MERDELQRSNANMTHEELVKEICVKMLVDLQEKQALESKAVQKVATLQVCN